MDSSSNYLQVIKDPRCPQCGRAVLGGGVVGLEGTYHQECIESPYKIAPTPYPQPWQPIGPTVHPWPLGPTVTWEAFKNNATGRTTVGLSCSMGQSLEPCIMGSASCYSAPEE